MGRIAAVSAAAFTALALSGGGQGAQHGGYVSCVTPYVQTEAQGDACRLGDGLYRVLLADGRTVDTHGPDGPPPKAVQAQPRAGAKQPVCSTASPSGNDQIVAVVAHPRDVSSNMTDATLRGLIQTMDGILNASAVESGGVGGADYVFACDSAGRILIEHATLPTNSANANFSSIVSDLESLGFTNSNEKYAVWYDDGGRVAERTNYCGQAGLWGDETADGSNENNSGPSYSLTYDNDYWNCGYWTLMHELGHNLGAVQYDAPHSTGAWHCWEGEAYISDTMCYDDGGPKYPGYLIDCGSTYHFDCNHNDYFDAAIGAGQGLGPGSYLDTNWNIGACYDNWIVVYRCQSAPSIDSFAPTTARVGDTITLTGTHFTGASSVKINGSAAAFTVDSTTQITAEIPARATSGAVSVTTPAGASSSSDSFTLLPPPPVVAAVSPAGGIAGTVVTITGKSLDETTGVSFNGIASEAITPISATKLTAVVPPTASTGHVGVSNPGGEGESSRLFVVYTAPAPAAFAPLAGRPGTVVTLSGSGFLGATGVRFGTLSASFHVKSDASLTATVPSKASTSTITVVDPAAPNGVATASVFTIVAAPKITSVTPAIVVPGDTVTINGSNLYGDIPGATVVKINGKVASVVAGADPATQLVATVPDSATSGRVTVSNAAGAAASPVALTVGRILSFAPASGNVGAKVAISGAGFLGATAVTFNGVAAAFSVESGGKIVATVPGGTTTGTITVTTPEGVLTSSKTFTVG